MPLHPPMYDWHLSSTLNLVTEIETFWFGYVQMDYIDISNVNFHFFILLKLHIEE